MSAHDYLPAAGHDLLLPAYETIRRLCGVDALLPMLIDAVPVRPGATVLDVGAGTGALTLAMARRYPAAHIVGVDPDPKALARARRKLTRTDDRVRFEQGYGQDLPLPGASVDHVVSAFVLHHLDAAAKAGTFAEIARVLRPDGTVHLLDMGGSVTRSDGLVARLSARSAHLTDSLGDGVPQLLAAAGLVAAREADHRVTRRLGRVTLWTATSATSDEVLRDRHVG